MIEMRYAVPPETTTKAPRLQYRVLFYPQVIASGDIVLAPEKNPEWVDVPLVVVPSSNAQAERREASASSDLLGGKD